MRKTVAYLLMLVMFLTGCGEKTKEQEPADHTETISALVTTWALETEECCVLQRKLARWYNVNLRSENPETGFERAYNRILYYDGGVMGYVELPSQGLHIPIFHGTEEGGFSHDPNSSFPIGGRGEHSLLSWNQEISLAEGEAVILWILGEPLTYKVGQEGENMCTLICGETRYVCGRIVED